EVKTTSGGAAFLQNCGYYYQFYIESTTKKSYGRSACPCLLISFTQQEMVIFGAVFTDDGPIIDPYYSINLLYVPNDDTRHKRVAQTICVLREAIYSLNRLYRDETECRPIDGFPFLCVVELDGQETPLTYQHRIGKSLVFRAKLGITEEDVVVKVTCAYNTEAHMSCTPFSPQIRAVIKQLFGWTYVIMDYVAGVTPTEVPEEKRAVVKESVNKAINRMHEKGFVHGDLRPCNILVRQQDCFVYIIDFDYSGKEGEAKYPYFLNTKDIRWPDGVASGKVITQQHDKDMISKIFSEYLAVSSSLLKRNKHQRNRNTSLKYPISEHALYRQEGKHCTLKDSSCCLTEAEANEGLQTSGNLYTPPACLLNHKVVQQAILCALYFYRDYYRVCLGCTKGRFLANLLQSSWKVPKSSKVSLLLSRTLVVLEKCPQASTKHCNCLKLRIQNTKIRGKKCELNEESDNLKGLFEKELASYNNKKQCMKMNNKRYEERLQDLIEEKEKEHKLEEMQNELENKIEFIRKQMIVIRAFNERFGQLDPIGHGSCDVLVYLFASNNGRKDEAIRGMLGQSSRCMTVSGGCFKMGSNRERVLDGDTMDLPMISQLGLRGHSR
ncbi:hypothetical protein PROFUN_16701, partial [Planoprotostelium fungivorum]